MSVKQRLIQYIRYKELSIRAFEKSVALSNGYINNITQSISETKLKTITLHYPDLNPVWIIFGQGDMLLPKISNDYKEINLTSVQKEPVHLGIDENGQIKKAILLMAETANKLADENRKMRAENEELKKEIEVLKKDLINK